MSNRKEIKQTGATFTPKPLADFLSSRLVSLIDPVQEISVLDPACGDGELLLSIADQLTHQGKRFTLTGFDSNNKYLSAARSRLRSFQQNSLKFIEGDFLDSVNLPIRQISIDFGIKVAGGDQSLFDVIIANPPYVRTQVLGSEKAQALARKFNLKGRVDLYYAFLISMTNSLKERGLLAVITSNRYLSTKSGESIRKFLAENYEVLEVVDLGDTKLFDAAVLPALLIARKRTNYSVSSTARFVKLYEELNGYQGILKQATSIYDVLYTNEVGYFQVGQKRFKKTEGALTFGTTKTSTWELFTEDETEWAAQIDAAASCRIGDIFKVKVGIKTTADRVFISDEWNKLDTDRPEDELLKNLLSQETIRAWQANGNESLKVLYPHYSVNGRKQTISLDKYPKAKTYLLQHESQLRNRKYLIDAGREWFEIWVPHNPAVWAFPKLVFPDISATPRFCFDTKGYVVNGNCYWIAAKTDAEKRLLLLIQGIANSKLMTKYHDLTFNNRLYSGRRRYLSQYVERYPLPEPESELADRIVDLVSQLNSNEDSTLNDFLEQELEAVVAQAFGVLPVNHLEQEIQSISRQ